MILGGLSHLASSRAIVASGFGFGTALPSSSSPLGAYWRFVTCTVRLSNGAATQAEVDWRPDQGGFGDGSLALFGVANEVDDVPFSGFIPPGRSAQFKNVTDPNVANALLNTNVVTFMPPPPLKNLRRKLSRRGDMGNRRNIGTMTSRVNGLDRLVVDYISIDYNPSSGAATAVMTATIEGTDYTFFSANIPLAADRRILPYALPLPPGGKWSLALTNATVDTVYEQEL